MATICVYKWMYLYLSSTMISNRPQQKRACGCVCNLESISFCKTDLLISSSLYKQPPKLSLAWKTAECCQKQSVLAFSPKPRTPTPKLFKALVRNGLCFSKSDYDREMVSRIRQNCYCLQEFSSLPGETIQAKRNWTVFRKKELTLYKIIKSYRTLADSPPILKGRSK